MNINNTKQPTESSLCEENPFLSKDDVSDEEKNVSEKKFGMKTFEMTDDILSYLQTLTKVAVQKTPDMIINRGIEYSLCLMCLIIDNAGKKIRILSLDDNLNYLCYEPIFNNIIKAQQKGVNVEILTNIKNPIGGMLDKYSSILKTIPEKAYIDYLKKSPAFKSFITGDDTMYRFEYDLDTISGLGSFNDPEMTGNFNNIFDYLYEQC